MPNAAFAVSQITGSTIINFTDSVASFKKSFIGLIFTKMKKTKSKYNIIQSNDIYKFYDIFSNRKVMLNR